MYDTDYMSDWYLPIDFGNDIADDAPDGEDNFNFE